MISTNVKTIDHIKWSHPSSVILSGPSSSGKTTILGHIVEDSGSLYDLAPGNIILYYREEQSVYKAWVERGLISEMNEGFPDREDFMTKIRDRKDDGGTLVIFDDLGLEMENNLDFMNELFTVIGHHYCVSIILVLHNLFSRSLRTLSLNCNRFILTKSLRDRSQVRCLATQSFPGKVQYIMGAYEDAISKKYGFLVLDFSPSCDPNMVVTSGWFSWDLMVPFICSYLYKAVSKDKSRIMDGSDCFAKQAIIPFSKYLKLVSPHNDGNVSKCGDITSGSRSNSNISVSYTGPGHADKGDPDFQETTSHSENLSRAGEMQQHSEQIQSKIDLPPPIHSVFQGKPFKAETPPPTSLPLSGPGPLPLIRSQTINTTTNQDKSPHIPNPPHPPPVANPSNPSNIIDSSAVALRAPSSDSDRREQLHNELNLALLERSTRLQPRMINRPPPKPLPSEQYDARRALHQEIVDTSNARSLLGGDNYSVLNQNMETLQPNGASPPLRTVNSHAAPTVYQPLQALENLQQYPPDSAYPIAVRNQDVDISVPLPYVPQDVVQQPSLFVHGTIAKKRRETGGVKKAAKGMGKKKTAKLPSRHELFTPSEPLAIEDFSGRNQSKSLRGSPTVPQPLALEEIKQKTTQRVAQPLALEEIKHKTTLQAGKRKGKHLTKPRPTFKAKRVKLGMGEKRKNAFNPPKPKRHMQFSKAPNTNFTLWNM